jgi:hypothetical protein
MIPTGIDLTERAEVVSFSSTVKHGTRGSARPSKDLKHGRLMGYLIFGFLQLGIETAQGEKRRTPFHPSNRGTEVREHPCVSC